MVLYWYWIYIWSIINRKTKPHLFSWIVFLLIGIVSFIIQYNAGAGSGSWWTLWTTIASGIVFLLAFKYGSLDITKSDIFALIMWILSIGVYIYLDDPYLSTIIIMFILVFAFYPTIRKTYNNPYEEKMLIYMFSVLRSIIWILATVEISFLTIGIPLFIIVLNWGFVLWIFLRKKKLCNISKVH